MTLRALAQLGAYVLMVVVVIIGFVQIGRTNDRLCHATTANRAYIRGAIERGRKTLPTVAYYRDHPDELARQQQELRRSLAELPGEVC